MWNCCFVSEWAAGVWILISSSSESLCAECEDERLVLSGPRQKGVRSLCYLWVPCVHISSSLSPFAVFAARRFPPSRVVLPVSVEEVSQVFKTDILFICSCKEKASWSFLWWCCGVQTSITDAVWCSSFFWTTGQFHPSAKILIINI